MPNNVCVDCGGAAGYGQRPPLCAACYEDMMRIFEVVRGGTRELSMRPADYPPRLAKTASEEAFDEELKRLGVFDARMRLERLDREIARQRERLTQANL